MSLMCNLLFSTVCLMFRLASQWRPNVNLYFQSGCTRIGPYLVIVPSGNVKKKFCFKVPPLQINLERWNFQGMSPICQKKSLCLFVKQVSNFCIKRPNYPPHPIQETPKSFRFVDTNWTPNCVGFLLLPSKIHADAINN